MRIHYDCVIMTTIASQITSLTVVYSIVYSDADQRKTSKLHVTGLCVGNSPGTGEFPAQMASYVENVSIWWRHHVSIIKIRKLWACLFFIMGFLSQENVFILKQPPGLCLNIKTIFPGTGITMLKIRRPLGRLIFNMGIAIPGKTVFLIETAPRSFLHNGIPFTGKCFYTETAPWALPQYKDHLSRYGDYHVKDKMVTRLSYH